MQSTTKDMESNKYHDEEIDVPLDACFGCFIYFPVLRSIYFPKTDEYTYFFITSAILFYFVILFSEKMQKYMKQTRQSIYRNIAYNCKLL